MPALPSQLLPGKAVPLESSPCLAAQRASVAWAGAPAGLPPSRSGRHSPPSLGVPRSPLLTQSPSLRVAARVCFLLRLPASPPEPEPHKGLERTPPTGATGLAGETQCWTPPLPQCCHSPPHRNKEQGKKVSAPTFRDWQAGSPGRRPERSHQPLRIP